MLLFLQLFSFSIITTILWLNINKWLTVVLQLSFNFGPDCLIFIIFKVGNVLVWCSQPILLLLEATSAIRQVAPDFFHVTRTRHRLQKASLGVF